MKITARLSNAFDDSILGRAARGAMTVRGIKTMFRTFPDHKPDAVTQAAADRAELAHFAAVLSYSIPGRAIGAVTSVVRRWSNGSVLFVAYQGACAAELQAKAVCGGWLCIAAAAGGSMSALTRSEPWPMASRLTFAALAVAGVIAIVAARDIAAAWQDRGER